MGRVLNSPDIIASKIAVVDDSFTGAYMYPVWVPATPGSEAVYTSSGDYQYNPSLQTLYLSGQINLPNIYAGSGRNSDYPADSPYVYVASANGHLMNLTANGGGGGAQLILRGDGTGTAAKMIASNTLGFLGFRGKDDVGFSAGSSASITATATETWSSTAHGTALRLAVTPNGSVSASVTTMYIDQNGYVGIGNTAPSSLLHVSGTITATYLNCGAAASQFTANVSARAGVPSNAFEWGHSNTAGYGCTIGYESSSGAPYIAFHGQAGTTASTYKTVGKAACIIKTDNAGALLFGAAVTASADNQAFTQWMSIGATGTLNTGAVIAVTNSAGAQGFIISNAADTSYLLGLKGGTKGIRFGANSTGTFIQGVDNTLSASFQPLSIGGSTTNLNIAGTPQFSISAAGAITLGTAPPAFAAGDKYLVIDASGNIHKSAVGPAS